MQSLGIVQWNSTRRDHSGNLGGVSGSGPVSTCMNCCLKLIYLMLKILELLRNERLSIH